MKGTALLFGALLIGNTLAGCSGGEDVLGDGRTPEWVQDLIGELEAEPVRNPPASITRYLFEGDTVYYVPPFCCDMTSVLYSSDGEVLCAPDGGLAGTGDGQCADFHQQAEGAQLIWQDSRSYP